MELTLNAAEQELLLEILEEDYRGLLWEIARTNRREFKHGLKSRAEILESIIHKLELAQPAEMMLPAA